MSMKLHQRTISGTTEQETLMKEVLEGLEEVATMLSYDPWPGDFEIIAIYPAEQEDEPQREETVIKAPSMPRPHTNVVSYQEYKKLLFKRSA
jgi:hypothetical protein